MGKDSVNQQNNVGDSARSKVPKTRRLGFWFNLVNLGGFILVISSLLVGGTVGTAFSLNQAVPILLFSAITTVFLATAIGVIGTRTGYSSALIYRFSYGTKGVLLPSIVMAITGIGWFALILNITRDAFAGMFGLEAKSLSWWAITILFALLFMLPAYKSVKWIGYINWVATPTIVGILIYVFYYSIVKEPGIWSKTFTPELSVLAGITMGVGGWIQGAAVISDFTRYIKNTKQTVIGLLITFGFLVFFQFLGGAVGAAATGDWNIFNILAALGVASFAFIGVFFGAWSTTQAALYGSSLAMSAPPMPLIKNQETTRRLMVIILFLIAFIGSIAGIESFINWYLPFLSFVCAPIIATVAIDYWAFKKRRELYEKGQPDMKVNPAAFVTWIVGFVVGYFTNSNDIGSAVLNSLFISAVLYYGWMRLAMGKNVSPNINADLEADQKSY
ncbi:cytosine permease [Fredinandcohnia sp. FSL W7-1320]|uniref:cytosine permease n=1 Tax=Fredinandcohnia sp. FSL W7-1320 TaxID=2954540 RepID=UPI0030FDCC82